MNSSILLLACLIFALVSSAQGSGNRCIADIFRVVGANDLYSLPCRCDGAADDYVARATVFLGDSPNTAAQANVTVECLENARKDLARNCDRHPDAYEVRTRAAIQRCLDVRPAEDAPGFNATFSFDRSMCRTIFRRVDAGPRMESVVVCACEQRPSYVVHPGVAQFFDIDAPQDATEERDFIRECIASLFANLEDTCRSEPARFELRSLQLLNTCCKRARVLFDEGKLVCQDTVPDDVSQSQLDVIVS